jgi:hypothetical protein
MCAQASLPASYWGLGALMTPNTMCESTPVAIIFNRVLDVNVMGVHYFGEYVIIPKQGTTKQMIGIPRNELARIIGIDNLLNGGWIVLRMGANAGPVTRKNPVSISDVTTEEMTEEIARKYMPIRRADGTIEFKTRKPDSTMTPAKDSTMRR